MNNIISFYKESEQKKLYFQIANSFKSYKEDYELEKIQGLYAIYKENICLYVGQSTNLPSRLATHLKGKYETCERIEVFIDTEEMGNLVSYEKEMIQNLKPIENVLVDFSEKIDIKYNPCYDNAEIIIINSRKSLTILYDFHIVLYTDNYLLEYFKNEINKIEEFQKKEKS